MAVSCFGCTAFEKSKLGFYPASEFAVHRTILEKRGPLHWPGYLQLSPDHTHPRWRFASHHRLKNLLVCMEWLPGQAGTMAGTPAFQLSETQRQRLHRLVAMYDSSNSGRLDEASLRRVLSDLGLRPDEDERAKLRWRRRLPPSVRAAQQAQRSSVTDATHRPSSKARAGRYWVVLSLREAESLRGALHLSMDTASRFARRHSSGLVCACPIRLSSTRVQWSRAYLCDWQRRCYSSLPSAIAASARLRNGRLPIYGLAASMRQADPPSIAYAARR